MNSGNQTNELTLGRQLSSRVWLAHRRTSSSVESVVALKFDERPPSASDWQLLGSPARIEIIRGERYLVADAVASEPSVPGTAFSFQSNVPRLRQTDNEHEFSIADIISVRSQSDNTPNHPTFFGRVRGMVVTRVKMVAFAAGVATVGIVCGVIFLPHSAQTQTVARAEEISPRTTPTPETRETDLASLDDPSADVEALVNAQWVQHELVEVPITSQAAILSKNLGWTRGMEIATRELSKAGDVGMYEVCTINELGKPMCIQVVTESTGKEIEIREIVRPAT